MVITKRQRFRVTIQEFHVAFAAICDETKSERPTSSFIENLHKLLESLNQGGTNKFIKKEPSGDTWMRRRNLQLPIFLIVKEPTRQYGSGSCKKKLTELEKK
jgi:hypothetical protein